MHFRTARHTNDLGPLIDFYTRIIGLKVTDHFEDHAGGYNGVILGKAGESWELEFTTSKEPAQHSFDQDDNLVFYASSLAEYDELIKIVQENNIERVSPANPYWDVYGITVRDPDGYRVIISNRLLG